MKKRFQECNKIIQIWRYRWYSILPFLWLWHSIISPMRIYQDEIINGKLIHTDNFYIPHGKNLWKLLKGEVQYKMKWYWTHEEVMSKLKIKK